jgi:light-regulated signal transduction histidine kinase (bacteriophytochrome)
MNEKSKMYMQKIVQSSGRMQRLIDDILAFSSLRVTREAFRPTDLNAVLKQVLSDMEVRIENTGATIRADKLPTIDAIPSQMGQLLQNLLSNALKFRKEEVPPVITITCKAVGAEEVKHNEGKTDNIPSVNGLLYNRSREQFAKIEIRDNGIGFDEEYAEKIFEIFQRLHSSKTFEGTGIWLAICKKIVDNHHGAIAAASRPGKGATFIIYLPFSQKSFLNGEPALQQS